MSALGDAVRLRREERGMGQAQLVERAWEALRSRDGLDHRPTTDEVAAR